MYDLGVPLSGNQKIHFLGILTPAIVEAEQSQVPMPENWRLLARVPDNVKVWLVLFG